MPLYANNQKEYTVKGYQQGYDEVAAKTVNFAPVLAVSAAEELITIDATGNVSPFIYRDTENKVEYTYKKASALTSSEKENGWRTVSINTAAADNVKVLLNGTDVTGQYANMTETVMKTVDVQGQLAYTMVRLATGGYQFTTNSGKVLTPTSGPITPAVTDYWQVGKAGNLQATNPAMTPKAITYDDVINELFKGNDRYIYSFIYNNVWSDVACTSSKQVEKLLAMNKLMNVAKYFNMKKKVSFTK